MVNSGGRVLEVMIVVMFVRTVWYIMYIHVSGNDNFVYSCVESVHAFMYIICM